MEHTFGKGRVFSGFGETEVSILDFTNASPVEIQLWGIQDACENTSIGPKSVWEEISLVEKLISSGVDLGGLIDSTKWSKSGIFGEYVRLVLSSMEMFRESQIEEVPWSVGRRFLTSERGIMRFKLTRIAVFNNSTFRGEIIPFLIDSSMKTTEFLKKSRIAS